MTASGKLDISRKNQIRDIAKNRLTTYIYGCSDYWVSEASPTLGCSIEISRDIYMYVSVVCQITWNHVNQIRACSKSVLGGTIRPVTPVLFISAIRYSSFSMDGRETFT